MTKLAVVTGSSGGIGQSVCKVLAVRGRPSRAAAAPARAREAPAADSRCAARAQDEGYTVVGIDKHACPALDGVGGVHQLRCDLRDLSDDALDGDGDAKRATSAARTLKSLLASLQPATTSAGVKLALLVNNAAAQVVAPFAETSLKDFNEVISTNLTAPYMLTKLLLPELKASRRYRSAMRFAWLTPALTFRNCRRREARWSWCRPSTRT